MCLLIVVWDAQNGWDRGGKLCQKRLTLTPLRFRATWPSHVHSQKWCSQESQKVRSHGPTCSPRGSHAAVPSVGRAHLRACGGSFQAAFHLFRAPFPLVRCQNDYTATGGTGLWNLTPHPPQTPKSGTNLPPPPPPPHPPSPQKTIFLAQASESEPCFSLRPRGVWKGFLTPPPPAPPKSCTDAGGHWILSFSTTAPT